MKLLSILIKVCIRRPRTVKVAGMAGYRDFLVVQSSTCTPTHEWLTHFGTWWGDTDTLHTFPSVYGGSSINRDQHLHAQCQMVLIKQAWSTIEILLPLTLVLTSIYFTTANGNQEIKFVIFLLMNIQSSNIMKLQCQNSTCDNLIYFV